MTQKKANLRRKAVHHINDNEENINEESICLSIQSTNDVSGIDSRIQRKGSCTLKMKRSEKAQT